MFAQSVTTAAITQEMNFFRNQMHRIVLFYFFQKSGFFYRTPAKELNYPFIRSSASTRRIAPLRVRVFLDGDTPERCHRPRAT